MPQPLPFGGGPTVTTVPYGSAISVDDGTCASLKATALCCEPVPYTCEPLSVFGSEDPV